MRRRFKQNPNIATDNRASDVASSAMAESILEEPQQNTKMPSGGNESFFGRIFEAYAKIRCRMNNQGRLRIYRKMMSLIRNRFSLMDSLDRMYEILSDGGKDASNPMAVAVMAWSRALGNGETFSAAVRGWAPSRECLMLSTGDVSDLDEALENLIKVTEGAAKMTGPIINAVLYPAFLSLMTVLIIYGVGAYLVPPMVDAAPNIRWTGMSGDLIALSNWVTDNWLPAFLFLPTIFFAIYITLPRWKGITRAWFDKYPPWSLYRVYVGVSWLLTFAALVKAGTPVSKAMRALRADSNPYLLERIDKALVFINNGDNIGDALLKTRYGFPDNEIIGDLRIYSELDNFQEALNKMANDWLEQSLDQIEKRAAVLNTIAILSVIAVVGWVVIGTFDMQDQIARAIG